MPSPLAMPNRRKAPSVRLAYRTSTGQAARDKAILATSTVPVRDWPACCETGDKSLARITGCPVCVL